MAASLLECARKGLRFIETTGARFVMGWLQQRRREGPDPSTQAAPDRSLNIRFEEMPIIIVVAIEDLLLLQKDIFRLAY